MFRKHDQETQNYIDSRVEDYWDNLQIIANRYRADPNIRKQQRADTIKYWLIICVYCFLLGPAGLLFIYWLQATSNHSYIVDGNRCRWFFSHCDVYP